MTSSTAVFRCSATSRDDQEPMAGTAPTETAWLLVEYAGGWGRQAVAESRLPDEVRRFLGALDGVRVQLVRRHRGVAGPGLRVFMASLGADPWVQTTLLDDVRGVLDLDVAALAAGADPGLTPYDGPLWLVCTNGRRDLCCAEIGRPIAAALAERWPEATWETTHLGGHRFAGTLVALPSGITLGRLDAGAAVAACADLVQGRVPLAHARGRAGLPGVAQVAELHLRAEPGALAPVRVTGVDGEQVTLEAGGETWRVVVHREPGEPRRQSCAGLETKPAPVYAVASWVPMR